MIHVCFGLHDKTGRYSKFTGTAMLSLFDNTTSEVTVHILHDNTLTQDNREKFIYLAGRYNQLVKFYNVEQLCADKISEMINLVPAIKTSRLTIGAFYRLLIPQLLPDEIDKCIYLDSDIIVNLDINELWRIELGDKPLGAIPESKASSVVFKLYGYNKYLIHAGFVDYNDYFNSGVMIMNLNYFRSADKVLKDGIKFRGEHTQCNAFDQDILIRKDESIILAESEQSFQKLIDAMKKAKGKKVFFIVLPNFPFNLLIKEGFVPGKDFVNGLEFLSEAQGLPLNSYPFVQAM